MIGPATLAGTTASFPITGGRAALDLSAAIVRHSGGISLTKGATVVALTDFDIRVGRGAPQLFAALNGGADEGRDPRPRPDRRDAGGRGRDDHARAASTAKLTQGAADALNAAFGTTAFGAGLVLGRRR